MVEEGGGEDGCREGSKAAHCGDEGSSDTGDKGNDFGESFIGDECVEVD